MNKLKILSITLSIAILSGCASGEYKMYVESVTKVEMSKSLAEAAKYKAMSDIAASGSESAKMAAVMALALGGNNNNGGGQQTQLKPPTDIGQTALQWAGLFVPMLTQAYGIHANTQLGMANSNNSARISESTNAAFLGIAGKIQAPVTVLPQANVTTTSTDSHNTATTLSGSGVIGSGTYAANPTTTTSTLSGTGVLGSGTYTTAANPTTTTTTDSHNTANPVTTTTTTGPSTTGTTTTGDVTSTINP
jgi:hypothetical protein